MLNDVLGGRYIIDFILFIFLSYSYLFCIYIYLIFFSFFDTHKSFHDSKTTHLSHKHFEN